jgi:hypothetical protein
MRLGTTDTTKLPCYILSLRFQRISHGGGNGKISWLDLNPPCEGKFNDFPGLSLHRETLLRLPIFPTTRRQLTGCYRNAMVLLLNCILKL